MRRAERLEQELYTDAVHPRLEPFAARDSSIEAAARFGSTFTDDTAATRSYAAMLPKALEITEQLELQELPGYTTRAHIRASLADKIEHQVFPLFRPRWLERYPVRLRTARKSGAFGVQVATGRPVVFWDHKAGLSRLCPDDAREEAMRMHRRNEPTLRQWVESSATHRITYMVFTTPNTAPGNLREGMGAIFERFKRVILQSGEFPAVKGALCVLEAPLGRDRDWNVHLNVLLLHDGFVDWGKVRRLWHWNVHMQQLPRAPGAIGSALRELIKYAVAATVSKSEEKANAEKSHASRAHDSNSGGARADPAGVARADLSGSNAELPAAPAERSGPGDDVRRSPGAPPGDYPAPPMLEWTGAEVAEWLRAFHGFRRTRSYGCLYNLERPESAGLGCVAWLGRIMWQAGRYWQWLALLDSIPEDKSAADVGPLDRRTSWQRFKHRLRLDQVAPMPELGVTWSEIQAATASHTLVSG